MFLIYSLMSTLPGFYFTAPQIFPFTLGIPTYRDYFYPVLAFLIMALMLNEQKEKEMDTIFNLAVTKANADLEIEKNKKQHVFLGMLLHEIKTPLSVIKFGAAALSNDAPKTQIWTQRVDSAADAINHILNQCLLADKFEFGLSGYSAEKVNIHAELTKLIERVSYLNHTYLERIQWQFSQELPHNTSSMVDPIFLRSILENLLTNALKYSATNSSVQLLVHKKTVANQAMLEFQIKNQIGKVGPPQVDKIFSRYYRAEEAQGYSGTGLGLWLANQQAKEMGTSIECTFDDMWTSFTFQISLLEEIS
jgi:signal transduction histidine kinase